MEGHLFEGDQTQLFVSGRAGGKTTALIDWLAENLDDRVVLLPDAQRARLFIDSFRDRHPSLPIRVYHVAGSPGSFEQVLRSRPGANIQVGVDDAQTVLSILFGKPVTFGTWNVD